MVSWLEDRDTGELARGKYEMTIAPPVWYGYAPEEMLAKATEQVSTCTCGGNGLLFNEQQPGRIGLDGVTEVFERQRLVPRHMIRSDEPRLQQHFHLLELAMLAFECMVQELPYTATLPLH